MFFAINWFLKRFIARNDRLSVDILRRPDQSGALILCHTSQPSSYQVKIAQSAEYKLGMSIFGKTLVMDLFVSKNTLDNAKLMHNLCTDSRFVPIAQPLSIRQRFIPAAFSLGKFFGFRCSGLNDFTLSRIGQFTPDADFLAMQQIFKHLRFINIGRFRCYQVDDFAFTVDTNVGLHTKIPLIAFLGLMHLWITLLVLVLGRTRRIDDAGVHNGAVGYLYPLLLKVFSDSPKQLITQFF